jgi:predicted nucleotide-binding protein
VNAPGKDALIQTMIATSTDELFEVADAAANLRARIRDEQLQNPLAAIHNSCEEAKRSWSGSNLGYHATVYYSDLQPKPPKVEFSPEWGLMERWGAHTPDRGWRTMDHQAVVDEILSRAGSPDRSTIEKELASIRENFFGLKERATSLLSANLSDMKDSFLERKLTEIEDLQAPEARTIEAKLVHRGPGWSRDSLAVSQGGRIAPHQSIIALPLSAKTLENGIERLEKTTRESASHLRRLVSRTKKAALVGTNIFIGHGRSPVWRELKGFIEDRLGLPVDEFNSVPVAGIATTVRLSELLDAAAFAFLVMTAEDEQVDRTVRARENVVHEVGLFQGRLGFNKAIVLLEEGCDEFSNIHGLGQIRFPKGNVSAKFEEIRAVLEREQLIGP